MNDIKKYEQLDEKNISRNNYLQSLVNEALDINILGEVDINNIQLELMSLLAKQTDKYTSKDSSSVREETAQSIFDSICFTLSIALKENNESEAAISMLRNCSIENLFIKGQDVIKSYMEKAKKLLEEIQYTGKRFDNLAYYDTVFLGIPEFFTTYDWRFSAHLTTGSIDYPLSYDKMDLRGIEYIYEYLFHLYLETKFYMKFSTEELDSLMRGYSKYYKEDLLNLYELVIANLLARSLLGYELDSLEITSMDRENLKFVLQKLDYEELLLELKLEFEKIMICIDDFYEDEKEYLMKSIINISERIKHNLKTGRLEKTFITLKWESDEEEISGFVDGNQMEDEKLRELIDEIKECRYLKDKIIILKENVKSLADLLEILEEGFFFGEYEQVFSLLDNLEIGVIVNKIEEERNSYFGSNYEEKEWEKAFINYIEKKKFSI